jgi:protoporphyrinogen IX oxidase
VVDALLWIKVIHILAVISWMAGLFYLPRLFVYHSDVVPGGEASELFKVMERRLLKAIMRPAALVTLVSGIGLWWIAGLSVTEVWLLVKLLAVLLLACFHGFLEACVKRFARDLRPYSSRQFRVLNEVPTILLIVIVVMVVVKPFQ